jgi:Subtilase family/RTX calcium-binding nonapeptide repeat (4 copies)/Calx-beta domain
MKMTNQEKISLPVNESRISSDLLNLLNSSSLSPNLQTQQPSNDRAQYLQFNETGTSVFVRITSSNVTGLTPALTSLGFQVIGSAPALNFLEGYVPISAILQLENLSSQGLLGVVSVPPAQTGTGSVNSQADFIQEADRLRAAVPPGLTGAGVNIGVLSDSYNRLGGAAAGVASGDLPTPPVNLVLEGPANGIDEGRAMIELIHDLAPGAGKAFASAFFGEAAFAQSIRDLANPAIGNSQIITDDIFYFDEPLFQDGVIAQAINDVVINRNVAYFSLAGNLGTQSYESNGFTPAADFFAGSYHDFDPGAGVDTRQSITLGNNQQIILTLQWDDPFYTVNGVDTNLNFFLVDGGTNNVLASSTLNNIANQIPNERFGFTNNTGATRSYDILIQNVAGPNPGRIKYVNYGANSNGTITINEFATNSSTVIPHSAAVNGRSVGAVNYFDQSNPAGFTSAGPNTILFSPTGTPIAAQVRQNPDFAAIQGTDTTFFGGDADGNGFPNFFGTSAAAPHAAAIAALVRQANPGFTPAQIYNSLESTAEDISTPGFDNRTGVGLINAYRAVLGAPAPAAVPFSDQLNIPPGLPVTSPGVEIGGLGRAYATQTDGAGRIRVTNANQPVGGTGGQLTLDSSRNGFDSLNEAILNINAVGAGNLTLRFDQKEFNDDDNPMPASFTGSSNSDGVALSVDGTNWFRIVSLTGAESTNTFQSKFFNLNAIAAANGIALGANTRIKFQNFANAPIPNDGLAFDNIAVAITPNVAIAATDANKNEGNAGTTNFTFTATRTGDITDASVLDYAVTGATAGLNAADFVGNVLSSGTITFPAGSNATQLITVPVQGDLIFENDENFTVTLTSVSNANVTTPTATGTIINDEPRVSVDVIDPTAGETGLNFGTFRFTRSIVTAAPLDVNYVTAGQAINGTDYRTIPTTIQIPANQASVDLPIIAPLADALLEGNETATLNLVVVANGAYGAGAPVTGTVTIQDFVFDIANAFGSGVISRPTFNGSNLILGSNSDNRVVGSANSDTIASFAGDDVVYALGGNDSIDGGFGNDEISGGLGNDTLIGNIGNDSLIGVDLSLLGANETDVMIGGAGDDTFILGAPGFDFYVGNGNADFARIDDFVIIDTIQLNTAPSSVSNIAAPVPGVGIFVAGDLVAVVRGTDATIANVNNRLVIV